MANWRCGLSGNIRVFRGIKIADRKAGGFSCVERHKNVLGIPELCGDRCYYGKQRRK